MKNTYNGSFGLFDSLKKLLLLVLLFGGFSTFAQTTYQVGTGTGTNAYFPLYTYYGYTYSEQIYLASELTAQGATAGTISKIRFYYATAGTTTASDDSWEVFVGNTSQSSFSSTSNYITSTNMTSVYSGSVTYPSAGGNWMEISLTTPFFWDGVSNLVVGVDQNEPGYDYPYAYFGHTSTSTLRSIQYYNDGVNPNPASPPTGNTSSYGIANAQFVIAAASACTGTPAAATALASDTSTCANNPVVLSLGTSYNYTGMTYQWQSSSNGTTWTNITGATGPTYAATQSSATYYQCIITCTNSSSSVTSSSVYVSMNPFYDCYCPANSNYGTSGDYYASIYNVSFNTLNNSSSVPGSSPYYTNYAPVGNNTTTVFTGFSYTFSLNTKYSYTGVWIDWDQDGTYATSEYYPVAYNSSSAPTTYSITIPVPLGAAVGQTGMRVRSEAYFYTLGAGDPCTQLYYGETEDYTINVANPPTDDAGIAAINSPSFPSCVLDSTICVTVQNFGTDTLFSCDIKFAVNNGTFTTYNWTGMIPPQSDDTVCSQIGTATFNIGDDLTVVATNANGTTGSTYTANDTMMLTNMNVSLQGVYGIPADFSTLNDAVDALNQYGVCSDVVFNLASGTYNESMTLGNIAGMGQNATVTFKSAVNDTAAVTVEFAGNYDTNYVVKLNQASWFRFKNITFSNTSTSYGRVFDIGGNASNNIIDSNRIMTVNNTTTSNYNALVYSPGSLDNFNTYSNNSFEGGSYSLYLYGVTNAAGSYEEGTVIKNNKFMNPYYSGPWLYYQRNVDIEGNTITSNSTYSYGYGIRLYYCSTVNMNYNHMYSEPTGVWPYYGVYSYESGGSSAGPTTWTNNILIMPSNAYVGLYQYYTSYANIANNTVVIRDGSNTGSRAYQPYYSSLYFANNNIFVNYAGGYNVYAYSANAFELNHNAYFGTGANPFYNGGPTYSTFAAYQSALGGLEANSLWSNPNFADTTMGILCNDTLDGAGTPLSYVTDDFDHLNRNTSTPDIGAREFVSLANFALGSDTICGSSFEVVGPVSNASWTVNSVASTGNSVMLSTGTTPTTFNVDISFSSVCSVDTNGNQIPVTDAGTFRLIPSAELASTMHLCADDVATLSPGGGANATYLWFPTNETTSSIQIDGGGVYSVTKEEEGCMSQATIAVSESDGVDLQNAEVCAGDLPYQVDASIVGGQSYTWSEGSTTATVDLNTTGVYFVTVTDNQGCTSSDSIFFEAIDVPTVAFTETHSGYVYYFNSGNSTNVGSSASYAWSFGDGSPISTDANPTHQYPWASPSAPAVYVTTLTVTNACGTNDKTMEIMPDPVGINELGNSISYNVYPNPSNGYVNVEFTGTTAEQASLRVLDIAGRIVSESSANTNDIVTLNLSSVASGTYILEVNVDGAVSQTRISIQ